MFITYKGGQAAMHIEVGGRYFRLVPSQPVKLTDAQADKLQSRKLMQVLVDAGELEFSERAKPITEPDSNSQTIEPDAVDVTVDSEPTVDAETLPEQTIDPEPMEDEVIDASFNVEPVPDAVDGIEVDAVPEQPEPVFETDTVETPVETESVKPVSKMTVKELEAYITDNGGSYSSGDNKPELLVIAQDIENAKQ